MKLGRSYKRSKWEALLIVTGLVLWLIVLAGCQAFPTLTHPRSRDYRNGNSHIDMTLPNDDLPNRRFGAGWDIQPLVHIPEDGPDTPQKWDPEHGYNFGTGPLPDPKLRPPWYHPKRKPASRFNYHRFHLMRDIVIYGDKPCSDTGGFDVGIKYRREF